MLQIVGMKIKKDDDKTRWTWMKNKTKETSNSESNNYGYRVRCKKSKIIINNIKWIQYNYNLKYEYMGAQY